MACAFLHIAFKYNLNTIRLTRSVTKKNNQINQTKFNKINQINPINPLNPSNTLMSNGLKFEKKVYDYLQEKYSHHFINIIPYNNINFERDYKKLNKITLDLIKFNVPIIAQAVLVNKTTRMRGIVDLLIRSDYINRIFKRQVLKPSELKYLLTDHHHVCSINHRASGWYLGKKFDSKFVTDILSIDLN
jgi:hypothetical protein